MDFTPLLTRKRPTLTSFHPTPPGSLSLLQVSINSEEVQAARAAWNHRSRVDKPKRTGCPLTGCCQVRSLNSLSAACKCPFAGGAASSGPMMAKRSRAQRSRSPFPRAVKDFSPSASVAAPTISRQRVIRDDHVIRSSSSVGSCATFGVPCPSAPGNGERS